MDPIINPLPAIFAHVQFKPNEQIIYLISIIHHFGFLTSLFQHKFRIERAFCIFPTILDASNLKVTRLPMSHSPRVEAGALLASEISPALRPPPWQIEISYRSFLDSNKSLWANWMGMESSSISGFFTIFHELYLHNPPRIFPIPMWLERFFETLRRYCLRTSFDVYLKVILWAFSLEYAFNPSKLNCEERLIKTSFECSRNPFHACICFSHYLKQVMWFVIILFSRL